MCNMLTNSVALCLPVSFFALNLSPSLSLHASVTVASVDVLLATGGSICPKAHSAATLVPSPGDPFILYSWHEGHSETKPLITTGVKSIRGLEGYGCDPHGFAASVEQCETSGYVVTKE